jgi:cytochrome c5
MLSIRFLITLFVIAILAILVVFFNDRLITQISNPGFNSINVKEESAATKEVDPSTSLLSTPESGINSGEKPLSGPSIMETHCSECHVIQVLEQNSKSRSDWEITLEKMGDFGLQLSQEEQDILLDYLTTK